MTDCIGSTLDQLLKHALETSKFAGKSIMEVYESDFEVSVKTDNSPLTLADLSAHQVIVEALRALTPEVPILSEESVDGVGSERRSWSLYWLVDPLDGTKEFVKRNGEFTVNIALVSEHEPILGVVHVPALAQSYYGCRGHRAFFEDSDGKTVPISVSKRAGRPVRVVGSRSHRGASLDAFLEKVGAHELLTMGSSLKFCLVAQGKADIYPRLGPTSEWDTAAAHAVVECAGGHVVTLDGRPLRYNTKEDLLNPHFLVYGDADRDWTSFL